MKLFHILIDTQNKKKTELENVINIYKCVVVHHPDAKIGQDTDF